MRVGVTPDRRIIVMPLHLAKNLNCYGFRVRQAGPSATLPYFSALCHRLIRSLYRQIDPYDILFPAHRFPPWSEESGESHPF
jgi:hypothetical protein